MKNNTIVQRTKCGVMLLSSSMLLAGCLQEIDPESFNSGVSNTVLKVPTVTAIANADGSKTVVTWPVVMGADGMKLSLFDVNDPSNPIALVTDTLIDGCKCEFVRAEDTNYKLQLKVLGNKKYNNSDSELTDFLFTSMVANINAEPIPDGTDLAQWFADNKDLFEAQVGGEYAIELQGGKSYYVNGPIVIGNALITLRSDDANNPATIFVKSDGYFEVESGFKVKNLILDCSGMTQKTDAVFKLSAAPSYEKTTDSYLIGTGKPIVFQNCKVKGLSTRLLWDQGTTPYVIDNLLIRNCIIEHDQVAQLSKGPAHTFDLSKSFPIQFAVEGSTIYSTTSTAKGKYVYFITYVAQKPQNLCGGIYPTCFIRWSHNTVYNMTKSESGNNNPFCNWAKLKGQKNVYLTVEDNIFVDCAGNRVTRFNFLQGQNGGMSFTFSNNLYWYDGAEAGSVDWDMKDRTVSEDPQLELSSEGIFKVGNSNVAAAAMGDPRGLE